MASAEPGRARSGLALVLGATAIAGAAGYIIQAAVPAFAPDEYLTFTVTWSAIYLIVGGMAGVQQEVTRSAFPAAAPGSGRGGGVVAGFAGAASVVAVVVVFGTAFLWGPTALGEDFAAVLPPILVATAAYTLVAVLSGVYYGARRWVSAAGMTVTDALLRVVLIVVVMILGLSGPAYAWATAVPFVGSVMLLWILSGRRAMRDVDFDVDVSQLLRNSVSTVGAALATGVMISGLPLLLGITSRGLPEMQLTALILILTLTRAPLVIPLLALQSYLVVTFRDQPDLAIRRTLVWGAGLVGATIVLAVAGSFIGPWIVEFAYGPDYALPAALFGLIIASAGMTALLCLTGPAVLAAGGHRAYVAGWALSSIVLVIGLFVVPADVWSTVAVICAAPVLGVVVHLAAIMGRSRG
ncbi:hypothetical protein [Microbacterium plantarum]|uniref:Polysaccharide biosynthesis protein n=1 Tax=Microbacterium plantarum TaxID=1816425 RepID=A0ABV5EVA2_9MICO